MKKPPILVYSEFSGEIYIVTRYSSRGETTICAHTKYDVTEQFDRILSKRIAYQEREKRGPIPIEGLKL